MTLLIAAASALISCGGTGQPKQIPPTPLTQTTTQAVNGTVTVTMGNLAFNPSSITIDKGTKVTWTNKDAVSHSVVEKGGKFDSGLFGKGASFDYGFNESGTYSYYCGIHPGMTGTVTVK